jgi:hypothetical protein
VTITTGDAVQPSEEAVTAVDPALGRAQAVA